MKIFQRNSVEINKFPKNGVGLIIADYEFKQITVSCKTFLQNNFGALLYTNIKYYGPLSNLEP